MSNFEVKIETLIDLKLGFEEYFVLYCLCNKNKELLVTYINSCKRINTDVYLDLTNRGYINLELGEDKAVYFSKISLSRDGEKLFGLEREGSIGNTVRFDEFRNNYPSSIKEGMKKRRLHGNLGKCKKLYIELLKEVSHEELCKCARLYHKEMKEGGDMMFMQALETWLRQGNYKQYIDDKEESEEGGFDYVI